MKIVVIVNLTSPTSIQMLHSTLDHTGYCRRFIHNYASIHRTNGEIVEEVKSFSLNCIMGNFIHHIKEEAGQSPILVFPNWSMKFHVHVYASNIIVGVVLAQPG